jgi:hypothetical protein
MVPRWAKGVVVRAVAPLLLSCAALATVARNAHAAPAAVVLERAGVVWVTPAQGDRRVLLVLDPLHERARIEVSKDARAVIYFARSGLTYTVPGESVVEVQPDRPQPLTGPPPTLHVPATGKEVRLRADSVVLGGVVMRHATPLVALTPPPPSCTPSATHDEIARREPDPAAPSAVRVLFGLWLDEVCAREDANRVWSGLARELPFDDAIWQRIR